MKKNCPHVWALLNQKAKRSPPKGLEEFISGRWGLEGQRQLQLADARIFSLIAKTSKTIVGDAYRRDLSGVGTEHKLAELLCEITLVDALGSISDTQPVLRPDTGTGKQCDVKVVIGGFDFYGEVKRLADTWEGGARSIAKSPSDSKPVDTARPRAMDLFSKLKDAHRSGSAKLNSAISGNSWYKAGSNAVWQKGVSDGKEESIGAAHAPYPQSDVQGPRGLGRLAGR